MLKFENLSEKKIRIEISGEIGIKNFQNEKSINIIDDLKKRIENENLEEIEVEINSPGGNFFEGVSIYDTLKEHKALKTINIKGVAASAATIIAMSGDKINMSKNALFLIHNAHVGLHGTKEELENTANALKKIDNIIADIYVSRTGRKKEEIISLMNKNNGKGIWLNAEEAKKEKLIDNITTSIKNMDLTQIRNCVEELGFPEIPKKIESFANIDFEIYEGGREWNSKKALDELKEKGMEKEGCCIIEDGESKFPFLIFIEDKFKIHKKAISSLQGALNGARGQKIEGEERNIIENIINSINNKGNKEKRMEEIKILEQEKNDFKNEALEFKAKYEELLKEKEERKEKELNLKREEFKNAMKEIAINEENYNCFLNSMENGEMEILNAAINLVKSIKKLEIDHDIKAIAEEKTEEKEENENLDYKNLVKKGVI